jgi:hypothetical protein
MRRSTLWSAIQINGDVFLEGILGLTWFPSNEAERDRDRWENKVDRIITLLSKRHVSWTVMKTLSDSGRTVTIVPRQDSEETCNSTTYPESQQDAARTRVEAQDCSEPPVGDNLGTGKGTSVKITFSPEDWQKGGCYKGGAGRDGDEILLHEFCHAMRYATGQSNSCFASFAGFGSYEEFLAVVITNVFSSETGRMLRRDRWGHQPLPRKSILYRNGKPCEVELHDAREFCNWFRPQLEELKRYHPGLVLRLKSLNWIKWNPFRYLT